jgi:hypothetical protein
MADVTLLLDAAAAGDRKAAADLLPLVYDELRREEPGHIRDSGRIGHVLEGCDKLLVQFRRRHPGHDMPLPRSTARLRRIIFPVRGIRMIPKPNG